MKLPLIATVITLLTPCTPFISSPALTELPVDILHAIFEHIDDNDILPILTLSRSLRTIGLVTLINRHRERFDFEDQITLSSSSHWELYANLISITKLTCRLPPLQNNGLSEVVISPILRQIIAALPNVLECHIKYGPRGDGRDGLHTGFYSPAAFPYIAAILGHAKYPPNVIVIDTSPLKNTFDWISKRRRLYNHFRYPINITSTPMPDWLFYFVGFFVYVIFLQLWLVVDGTFSFFYDPLARKDQRRRVHMDLQPMRTSRSTQIIPISYLPIGAFRRNWILVALDADILTDLHISPGHYQFPIRQIHRERILLALCYPALTMVHVDIGASITLSELVHFLARHPTVKDLTVDRSSLLSLDDVSSASPPLHIHLETLSMPLNVLACLLPQINLQTLITAKIGCAVKSPHVGQPFDFGQLEHILNTMAAVESQLEILELWLPGGRAAEPWLSSVIREEAKRPERRLLHLRRLIVHAENVHIDPFHSDLVPLFMKWFELFSGPLMTRIQTAPNSFLDGN
ncbi:hypothetical protein Hypma_004980 [Hypsizygus marmoreus]|uniref:F-box domain-containing protein n=1 Tax=Hypsizygus marmoreus TaxID=39966 RepID=A0A369JXL5_HYPMA|nr:hypothetical protein Hypma_004980 [Hypsizygus marmoreus]